MQFKQNGSRFLNKRRPLLFRTLPSSFPPVQCRHRRIGGIIRVYALLLPPCLPTFKNIPYFYILDF